nr:unnamed protein product [Callosobruchus analis]
MILQNVPHSFLLQDGLRK